MNMLKNLYVLLIIVWCIQLNAQNPTLIDYYNEGKCNATYLANNYAYFAAGNIIKVVDFSDTLNINIVGELELQDEINDIIVKGDIAYIANNENGLAVLNIKDKSNPSLMYRIDSLENIVNLFEQDNYLYAIENKERIHILNCEGSDLFYLTKINMAGIDLEAKDNYLYVVDTTYTLKIFNITNISEPVEIATYNFDITDVEIKDDLLFLSSNNDSIYVYDISSPTELNRVNEYNIGYDILQIEISGNKMYVGLSDHIWDSGAQVYDITNENNIEYLQWLYIYTDYADLDNCDLSAYEDFVGYTSQFWGFCLYKLGKQEFQSERFYYPLPLNAGDVDISETHLFVADRLNGMRTLGMSDSSTVKQISFLPIALHESLSGDEFVRIKKYEDMIYLISYSEGIKIIDVSDPSDPILLNKYDNNKFIDFSDIFFQNNYGFLLCRRTSWNTCVLQALNISDPENIEEKDRFEIDCNKHRLQIDSFMNYCYILYRYDKICIINVSDPDSLRQIGTIDLPVNSGLIHINQDYLFISSNNSINIYDLSSPENPTYIGFYNISQGIDVLDGQDNYLYLAIEKKLVLLDVSDVSNINIIGQYEFSNNIKNISSSENKIYVSFGYNGIYILQNNLINRINESELNIPDKLQLEQNYPNPFNPMTNINFTIPTASDVLINIYNNLGQRIVKLVDTKYAAGKHRVIFDGAQLASGIYYYQIISNSSTLTKKMLLIK